MGFLDNLESSLKNLESQEERDPAQAQRRQDDRARTIAAAPWAIRLKESEYVKSLFDKAAVRGHRLRTKVYMVWFDSTLRLEARGRVLELKPKTDGVVAEYADAQGNAVQEKVNLDSDPDQLLEHWIGSEQRVTREEIVVDE